MPQRPGEARTSWALPCLLVLLLGLGTLVYEAAPAVWAAEPEIDARPEPAPPPEIDLDKLLKLPAGFGSEGMVRKGGATLQEWQRRFADARTDIVNAKANLAKTEDQLDQASAETSTWQVSAPGGQTAETSPLSFKLRGQVKEQRIELEQAERRLRALDIEADLATVPPGWRR